MDKREEKSIRKISEGFTSLIQKKDYYDITIQDILDESGVSRSTFYAHYQTKDDLLKSITDGIFRHVFSHTLKSEASHDFSKDSFLDYQHLITHIFYHMRDDQNLIRGILSSHGKDIFLDELREQLSSFANAYLHSYSIYGDDFPMELKQRLMVETFIIILRFWFDRGCVETPEEVTLVFIRSLK